MPSVVATASLAQLENNGNKAETVNVPVASANIFVVKNVKQISQDLVKLVTSLMSIHLAPCTKSFVAADTVAPLQRQGYPQAPIHLN